MVPVNRPNYEVHDNYSPNMASEDPHMSMITCPKFWAFVMRESMGINGPNEWNPRVSMKVKYTMGRILSKYNLTDITIVDLVIAEIEDTFAKVRATFSSRSLARDD